MAALGLCLLLLCQVATSEHNELPSAEQVLLSSDDECDDASGTCALSALQLQKALQQGEASTDVSVNADAEDEGNHSLSEDSGCHDMAENERGVCWNEINWARNEGVSTHPEWYPGLSKTSKITEWQMQVYNSSHPKCPRPCSLPAESKWCKGAAPPKLWKPAAAGDATLVKILSYNLFWWHLFGVEHGRDGSVGHLIKDNMNPEPFDVMGFQECEDPTQVLGPAGLLDTYTAFQGKHAVCVAYRTAAWNFIEQGLTDVAEDMRTEYYGTRGVMWIRLQHKVTGRHLFFANHHGPLSVNSGGLCGGTATAHNLLKVMGTKAQVGDILVLVGDFNANAASRTVQGLWPALTQIYNGESFGGVDNIFSNADMTEVIHTKDMGSGGSDHHAITATLRVGSLSPKQKEEAASKAHAPTTTTTPEPCHTTVEGDTCWPEVQWAKTTGFNGHPDWYPGLTASSSVAHFQAVVHASSPDKCPMPCGVDPIDQPLEVAWEDAPPIEKAEPVFSVDVLKNKAMGAEGCLIEPEVKYTFAKGWTKPLPGVVDPRVCCTLCQGEHHCKGWTWTEWMQSANGPQCTLHGGARTSRVDKDGWVSGLPKPQAVQEAEKNEKLAKDAV